MAKQPAFFNKAWKVNLLLLLISFSVYFFYFHTVFLNINSLMSSITGDSLKNYYTFAYFIKNDHGFLNFTGMNYPFGEHVTYIDCQPGVSWLLKLMPFTHNYLVGILHGLIFASFIISPLILNTLFKKLGLNVLPGFMVSLGITLLSPQFFRIYEGHYTLAYACIIPLSMLLIVNFLKSNATKDALWLFTFNTLIFLIHPYTAFGLCIFTLLSLLIFAALNFERKTFTSSIKWLMLMLIIKVPIAVMIRY